MTEQEQIEEIKEVICNMEEWAAHYYDEYGYEHEAFANCIGIASAIYNAGYRKADEVRKETAREILREIRGYYPVDLEHCDKGEAFILELCYELANKYDVKVKE